MIASTPASTAPQSASMLRRSWRRVSASAPRWWVTAPQQPAPRTRSAEIPRRSSTRAAAGLIAAPSVGCTQPSSSTTRRACRGVGPGQRGGRHRGWQARQLPPQGLWQQRPRGGRRPQQRPGAGRVRHDLAQQVALRGRKRRARDPRRGERAAQIQQPPVAHTRRTGTLAGAAAETAIQVQLGGRRDRLALEQLLQQVDAPARTVEFVAEQLIGRAGRQAEAAVHTAAQDRIGLGAGGGAADGLGECGLHEVRFRCEPERFYAETGAATGGPPVRHQPMITLRRCVRDSSLASSTRRNSSRAASAASGRLRRNPWASWHSCSCRNASCGKFSTPSAVTLMRSERDIAMIAAAIARSSLHSVTLLTKERSIFSRSTEKWRRRPKLE